MKKFNRIILRKEIENSITVPFDYNGIKFESLYIESDNQELIARCTLTVLVNDVIEKKISYFRANVPIKNYLFVNGIKDDIANVLIQKRSLDVKVKLTVHASGVEVKEEQINDIDFGLRYSLSV